MLKGRGALWLPPAAFVLLAVAIQLIVTGLGKEYFLTQLTMAMYYSLVAVGLCLVMGYAGQVSLGHAAFFALGGYATAVLTTYNLHGLRGTWWANFLTQVHVFVPRTDLYGAPILTVSPGAAFVVAIAGTSVVACLIGYPSLRLKGHYLAMATLGFGIIVYKILLATAFTGAADGINGVPAWTFPGGLTVSGKSPVRVQNYYFACVLTLLVLVALRNLVRSRVGRALLAIHNRETAATAMGINTAAYKLRAFVASAVLAAAAGVFFTHFTGGIGPSEAGPLKSVRYLALVAAGGMSSLWGVFSVSTVINYLSLRGWFGTYDHAVFGALLVTIISLAPEGPLEPLVGWVRRRRSRKQPTVAVSHGPA